MSFTSDLIGRLPQRSSAFHFELFRLTFPGDSTMPTELTRLMRSGLVLCSLALLSAFVVGCTPASSDPTPTSSPADGGGSPDSDGSGSRNTGGSSSR